MKEVDYLDLLGHDGDNGCPFCTGENICLGILNKREWRRCRDCGMDYSMEVER
jgi:transcription elongation factor Elf1